MSWDVRRCKIAYVASQQRDSTVNCPMENDMVALTYSEAPAVAPAKAPAKVAAKTAPAADVVAPRKSFFARFLEAMMEARMKQAQREIRLYGRPLSGK